MPHVTQPARPTREQEAGLASGGDADVGRHDDITAGAAATPSADDRLPAGQHRLDPGRRSCA